MPAADYDKKQILNAEGYWRIYSDQSLHQGVIFQTINKIISYKYYYGTINPLKNILYYHKVIWKQKEYYCEDILWILL